MAGNGVTREQLAAAFREIGLEGGDSVVVHSSLRSLGRVEGGPDTVIDALLDAVGSTGNLMFPTFNYSRPVPEPYDPAETPCRTVWEGLARRHSRIVGIIGGRNSNLETPLLHARRPQS